MGNRKVFPVTKFKRESFIGLRNTLNDCIPAYGAAGNVGIMITISDRSGKGDPGTDRFLLVDGSIYSCPVTIFRQRSSPESPDSQEWESLAVGLFCALPRRTRKSRAIQKCRKVLIVFSGGGNLSANEYWMQLIHGTGIALEKRVGGKAG